MRSLGTVFLSVVLVFATSSCSVNILENFADKTTNGALYEEAIKKINNADYDGAIADIAKMKGSFAATDKVTSLKASAYGGRCGLVFLDFVSALGGIGTTRLFPFLLAEFVGASSSKIDDCVTAQNLIQSIGTVAERSNDDNMFIALLEMAKLGKILTYYADVAQTGTVTAAYDPCLVGGPPRPAAGGNISDVDAAEFGAGIAIIVENLTALAGAVDLGSGTLTDVSALCASLGVLGAAYNFCTVTDPALYTANHILAVRSLILEGSAIGLQGGACPVAGDVTNPACRCF